MTKNELLSNETRNFNLLTDLYQLTMMQGYFYSGKNETAVFNAFYRKNPENGGYSIFAGLESIINYINNLHFTDEDILYLKSTGIFQTEFLEYLKTFHFSGNIYCVKEGTIIHPNEVLLKVVAPMIEAQFIETAILNFINHQSLIATKASRICYAAKNDTVMEFGLRRAQGPDAGILGARAAIIGGCSSTSNVLAGKLFDIPISGTHAHSWIMSFDTELEAFETYAKIYPKNIILLVDTYNTLESGIPNAIKVFKNLKAANKLTKDIKYGIRFDSGDLAYLSKKATEMFEKEGLHDAIICASNDLDEHLIKSLKSQGATINSWGVGTKLITSYNCAAFGAVYKLAALKENGKFVNKIKISENAEKVTNPGNKTVFRISDSKYGFFIGDLITLHDEQIDTTKDLVLFDPINTWKKTILKANSYTAEELLIPIFIKGKQVYSSPTTIQIREYCNTQKSHLWEEIKRFENPHKYYVDLSNKLFELKHTLLNEH